MSLEPCPFCGKPFKRLKSHLPHCKMSPGFKTTKNNKAKELLNTDPADTSPKDKKSNAVQATSKTQAKTKMKKVSEDALPDNKKNTDTVKPGGKWLAKREQEKANQVPFLTQKESKFTSDSQKEKHSCVSETSKSQVKETQGQKQKRLKETTLTSAVSTIEFDISAGDLLQLPWTNSSKQSMPKHKANANISENKPNSQMPLSNNIALIAGVKEQDLPFFLTTKTCVWDHIKQGLYDRQSANVPQFYPRGAAQETPISKCKHTSELKKQICVEKANTAPLVTLDQTTVQRPAEDILNSKLQSKKGIEWTPEMTRSYGGILYCPHSGISSNEHLWTKCQSSKPLPQNKGAVTEQRIGDVRLAELATWLCTRTQKSPREAVTMLNRGWQWYYRKYIDVQKGGLGGISMLIAGYCVLSYIWSYPHLKKERWRKYH